MNDSDSVVLEPWELQLRSWITDHIDFEAPQSILLLRGPMGSGKTTFAKHLLDLLRLNRGIESTDGFQSPTYSIHNRYVIDQLVVDHFDLYRLGNEDEVTSAGFWDLLESKKNWVIVEWPEMADGLWEMSFDATFKVYHLEFPLFRH